MNQMVLYGSGSSGLVDDNDFFGCGQFQCVLASLETRVDVTNNRFQVDPSDVVNVSGPHAVLRYRRGATGQIDDNQITGCFNTCISVRSGAQVLVRGNEITIPDGLSHDMGDQGNRGRSRQSSLVDDRRQQDHRGPDRRRSK